MSKEQIMNALEFGQGVIDAYKEEGKAVPASVYERMLKLQSDLIEILSNEGTGKEI